MNSRVSIAMPRIVALVLLCAVATQAALVCGQEAKGTAVRGEQRLASLVSRFEQAYNLTGSDLVNLNESYAAAIKRLLAERSKAGDLDAAVATKKEMEAFGDGSEFSRSAFERRASDDVQLQNLRDTYLAERQRLEKARWTKVRPLVESYRKQLADLALALTQSGELELAVKARETGLALDKDSRFSVRPEAADDGEDQSEEFKGRLIFLGKGEYEIRLNGKRLSYRNASKDPEHYVEFASDPAMFRIGDVVSIRMNSPYVYRGFIAAIESEDGSVVAPFRRSHYRILDKRFEDDAEAVLKLPANAVASGGDAQQKPAWQARKLHPVTRQLAEWVAIGSGKEWFSCAVVLSEEMLVRVRTEK